jgi:taurine dioxygenase
MLLARELPPIGGDTLWSSMYRAFETLSEPMQEFLAGLHCTHGFETKWDERAVHPVVLTHPETGRRALYVNKTHSRRIVELTEDESENLLAFLYRHVLSPDFSMRWTWRVGDIAFWDNRSAQHYAVGDYAERRVMHRMIIGTHTPSYVPETVATPLTVS